MSKQNLFKKPIFKKILIGVIIAIVVFISVSMVATKIIYDYIFKGYDCEKCPHKSEDGLLPEKEEHYYVLGDETLYGYRLKNEAQSDSLIVVAPGFNACADEYLAVAKYFLDAGYDIFIFDCMGSGKSTGTYVGFPQEVTDLDATLELVYDMGYENIFLFGHSRGGYAACCNINNEIPVTAVASISGVNSAMDGVMSSSVNAIGGAAYINYPFLWIYQNSLFGYKLSNISAADELEKSDSPALIIHGAGDTDFPTDKYSVYSQKDNIENKQISFRLYKREGHDGHTSILFDDDNTANAELMSEIDNFFKSQIRKGASQ